MKPPTDHQLNAAIRVARILGTTRNGRTELESALPLVISQGEYRAEDLRIGLAVLVDAELALEGATGVRSTDQLSALVTLDDESALNQLRRILRTSEQDLDRALLGAAGETAVVEVCRAEFAGLGRLDLVEQIVQVSLFDDSLGYDISAPTLSDGIRRLEVKTSSSATDSVFRFFLSRNEFEVGRRAPAEWALVGCERREGEIKVVGWCRAGALVPYLPEDHRGRWTEALVLIPRSVFFRGVPPCV